VTTSPATILTNAKGVVSIPFFRVGAPEYDLAALLAATSTTTRKGTK